MKKKHLILTALALAAVTAAGYLYLGYSTTSQVIQKMPSAPAMNGAGVQMGIAEDRALSREMMPTEPGLYPPPYYGGNDALDVDERVYRQQAYFGLVEEDVENYTRQIKEYILSIDGRVLHSSMNQTVYRGGQQYKTASLTTKVPADKFNEATTRVTEGVDEIMNESISATDETGNLVSNEERLQQLQDQLAEKEIQLVEAEDNVEKRRIELQIERLERQIQNVEKQLENVEERVQYSTLTITVADDARYFNPDQPLSPLDEAKRAWESVTTVLYMIAYFLIWVVVFSVVWLPLLLLLMLVKKLWKRRGSKSSLEGEK